MKKFILLFLIPFFFITGNVIHAENTIPDRPINGIYDPNHYLSEDTSVELAKANTNSDTQIGVYIVDTLDGKSIEEQANEVARSWKIGFSDTNKGALIAIAINDRKFRIETSNELNTTLTDSKAKSILDNVKPEMSSKNYNLAVQKIISEIKTISSSENSLTSSGDLNIVKEKLIPKKGLYAVADNLEKFMPVFIPMTALIFLTSVGVSLLNRNRYSGGYGSSDYENYHSIDELNLKKNRGSGVYSDSSIISSNYSSSDHSSSSHSYSGHSSSSSSSSYSSSSDWGGGGFDGGGASSGW